MFLGLLPALPLSLAFESQLAYQAMVMVIIPVRGPPSPLDTRHDIRSIWAYEQLLLAA